MARLVLTFVMAGLAAGAQGFLPSGQNAASAKASDLPCIPADPATYSIGAGDVLQLRVVGDERLTGQYVVRPDGKITIPYIGDVHAVNLTPDQLTSHVTQALKTILVQPVVTTSLWQNNSKKYALQGEVSRPGSRPLTGPTTVFDAIGEAGGFRDFAHRDKVLIIRANGSRANFNWDDYVKGKHVEQNVAIQNGDTIVVK